MLLACSLDWAVRPDLGDSSPSETGSGADVADAPVARDAADTSVPTDAPTSSDAADCAQLTSDVAQKRKKARDCQSAAMGQCTTTVDDECGCKVIVTTAGAPFTTDYTSAVSALLANCGKPACTASCPQLGLMTSWACLAPTGQFTCTP
jgi:hypothetical protein